MTWVFPIAADVTEPADVIGGKAHGLVVLRRLGLPVPDGFVLSTRACREFLRSGRLPEEEITVAAARLRAAGVAEVSVRSGASVSMPGMMTTVLGVRLDGDGLRDAIGAVFASWRTPRAVTYRELYAIPHDLGTAVTVQAMVYGDRDERSGSGVAFSRDPTTGEPAPFGEVLFERRGDAVVSGTELTRPLADLAAREPAVWSSLLDALRRLEAHYRDACYVEFTYESGALWLLQVRTGGYAGLAGVRVATDLVDKGVITRAEAVARVDPRPLAHLRTARIAAGERLARGIGACPGVAAGTLVTTADAAARLGAANPVILVRPETSPADLHGIAAAAGLVTARGGPASHAAVTARAMSKPAVVGVPGLVVDGGFIRVGARTLAEGTIAAIDGTSGEVVLGRPEITETGADPRVARLLAWAARTGRY